MHNRVELFIKNKKNFHFSFFDDTFVMVLINQFVLQFFLIWMNVQKCDSSCLFQRQTKSSYRDSDYRKWDKTKLKQWLVQEI